MNLVFFLSLVSLGLTIPDNEDVTVVTVAPSIPSDEPSYKDFDTFTSAILNSTNHYRAQHNASALSWNDTLQDFAEDYLDDSSCKMEHSGGPYGENLAIGYSNATAAVEAWGDEREEYDFEDGEFDKSTGHFTQLVWKDTDSVGCGRKLCTEDDEGADITGWYVACEYWPRGNVEGEFEDEVVEGEDDDDGALMGTVDCVIMGALGLGAALMNFV
ncbi:uncharacterized protein J7T54_007818 [Emericellopsis cladophorae]|uniref:SCP domain-containing protein n=1 Tax=Emericellopsis cladophorae TaxID=2686198 RepID=A0A9P9Y838_9HYPO|nr:uncharacterized protein J7T54_007818 [Emericellopsis cladophorae]KAI6784725.1 hypothetical protein J7T54_007818 [Emericellopsis cladophorae]